MASGSVSVAGAYGFEDGEDVPIEVALSNAERIVEAVDLPVTIDFEGGYAVEPDEAAANVARLAATGAIGCNFEDQVVGGEGMHPMSNCRRERIAAVRRRSATAFFINARTDLFLKAKPADHDGALADAAIERAKAYADAGASGFFIPGPDRSRLGRAHRRGLRRSGQRHDLARSADARPMGRRGNRADQLRAGPVPADAEWLEETAAGELVSSWQVCGRKLPLTPLRLGGLSHLQPNRPRLEHAPAEDARGDAQEERRPTATARRWRRGAARGSGTSAARAIIT